MKSQILIIRLSSIGDIVLTTPVVRCLKTQMENAEIHFVTKEQYLQVVSSNPYISKVHLYSGNLRKLIHQLRQERFDYIIDLQQNIRSNLIKFYFLNTPSYSYKKLTFKKLLLVRFKINRLPDIHIVDRYFGALRKFNIKNDEKGLDFFIPEGEDFSLEKLPESFSEGFIAFVIGGTWATKKLPVEKVIEICNQISYPVLLLGGKEEEAAGEEIKSQCGSNVINLAGRCSLHQSASLVRDAKLVLTNDTGLMHVSAAFKKKILSFWGNTVPEFGMTPYIADPASEIMEVADLDCRPCSAIGFSECPQKHFNCMKKQDVNKAVRWIRKNFNT